MEYAKPLLLLFLSSSLLLLSPTRAADPDPLQDFCVADTADNPAVSVNGFPCKPASAVTVDDFVFDGLAKEGNTSASIFGASITPANVLSFPALNTLGVSMNRVDIAPGGVNPPHIHPRATELLLLLRGRLLVGFVSTENKLFAKVLKPGENFVAPKGLVHFQYNVGEEKAFAITAFDSQFPGVVVAAPSLFAATPAIPDEVLTKALQVDQKVVDMIKSNFGKNNNY
ncbi:germin-like protein 3-8 [Canna indica]|uniref:Germin-like protein n=1 Tax=Canna indica TaxID=4628 RepID=A0AAQ3K8P2_9LILI|nr:germin-like protein 3-8 [Canna indica]WOL04208.1 germin-like protein 3-8 [Canna indica]